MWTGKQMIGWGGGCCDQQADDGAAYTPATNSWQTLPRSPLAGRHADGVWTGKEVIIGGGSGGYDQTRGHEIRFADAAAFDPATRTWRKLPSMPTARGGNYATVWDGREMLVIGGQAAAGSEPLARGVGYDPSTDRWWWLAPMPFPRTGVVTAWVSDQLIVWGGSNASIPPNGEAYDPGTNGWLSLPEAPLRARIQAAATWSGTEMIIWGGADARDATKPRSETTPLYDGAALTPASR